MQNFYDKVLHKIGKEKGKDAIYINIGAMDGVMFDDSAAYVATYQYLPLYVEPIPYLFEKLKRTIQDPRARFENCAISDYNGTIQMLMIDKEVIDSKIVHSCFYGMSAIYPPKNGLASEGDKLVVEKYGKLEIVPCLTLESLFSKYDINHIDILSIDTEGHDWKIVQQLDLKKYTPSVIRAEYINLTDEEKEKICMFFSTNDYVFEISGQNIDAIPSILYTELMTNQSVSSIITETKEVTNNEVTIVTALWNFGRDALSDDFRRSYDNYKEKFAELLKAPINMMIYISESDREFVLQHRIHLLDKTHIKIFEVEKFKTWFPFYEKIQEIRVKPEWYTQAHWLTTSPQARLEYYNPMVMSKFFLLNDATLFNPFNSEYFYWIDAGICNTVHPGYFYHDKVFDNLPIYTNAINSFLFLSYPYIGGEEIHGFPRKNMANYCDIDYVRYVCRGGFFGGNKKQINNLNGIYYSLLATSIDEGLMGTEESIFTIMSHKYPTQIYRFELSDNGLVWPFFERLKDVKSLIQDIPKTHPNVGSNKNIIYILTFNSPKQFESVVQSIKNQDSDMFHNSRKILVNNSTDEALFPIYDNLCTLYEFEELHNENLGVCGGRQFIAEHFQETDADFYMFFEDDMHLADSTKLGPFCKNGFSTNSNGLYKKVINIMLKEQFDFLKFSFTEFYGNNNVQWSWYNVPQSIREEYWPEYSKLPEHGLDPNAPKTKFDTIDFMEGTPYITGEIYYSNWPQIVSRTGNKKMFLDTKWGHPFEQTWMSHMYQLTKRGELRGAILLASPIEHNRFEFYEANLRKEN